MFTIWLISLPKRRSVAALMSAIFCCGGAQLPYQGWIPGQRRIHPLQHHHILAAPQHTNQLLSREWPHAVDANDTHMLAPLASKMISDGARGFDGGPLGHQHQLGVVCRIVRPFGRIGT